MAALCTTKGQLDLLINYPDKVDELTKFINERRESILPERGKGVLIECLHRAQELFGYIPRELQVFVAKGLNLNHSDVFGVISFYSYFNDKPVGRYQINICTGTACFVRGADRIMREFKDFLHIAEGQTTPDGNFSLKGLRCVGACSLAPVVMINDKIYGNVTARMVPDMINECN